MDDTHGSQKVVREQKDDSSRRVPESSAYGGGSKLDRPETVENVESASNDVTRLTTTSPNCPVINHRNESELMRIVDTEPDLQSKVSKSLDYPSIHKITFPHL